MGNNFILRVTSSAVLFIVAFLIFILGDVAFYIAILFVAIISYNEWLKMTVQKGMIFKMMGNLIILIPNSAIIYIYGTSGKVLLWMLLSIWANDIGAYFFGKAFGGLKLCPKISPNKTWTGLFGGMISALVVGSLVIYLSHLEGAYNYLVFTPMLPIIATISDLFESYIKRICKVKDSGNIIPGHGGILDRVDSFIFTAPFVAYLLFMFK